MADPSLERESDMAFLIFIQEPDGFKISATPLRPHTTIFLLLNVHILLTPKRGHRFGNMIADLLANTISLKYLKSTNFRRTYFCVFFPFHEINKLLIDRVHLHLL